MSELSNDKAKFNFQKFSNTQALPEDFWNVSWEELHATRSRIKKGLDHMLEIASKDSRDLSYDEDEGFKYGTEALDVINKQFELRSKEGTKEPVNPRKVINPLHRDSSPERKDSGLFASAKRNYRSMFKKETADNGDFESFDEFLNCIASGRSDRRLEKRTFLQGSGVAGGYAVPEEYAEMLIDKSLEDEIVRPRASLFPMASNLLHIPSWDNSNHATGVYGGFSSEWLGENSAATVETGKLKTMTLNARKLVIYSEASREVIADGLNLETQLSGALAKAMAFNLDTAFLSGSGVGRPLGVLNSPSVISVSRNTGGTVKYSDMVAMYSRLYPSLIPGAVWIINHAVLPEMCQMIDGGSHLIWMPGTIGSVSSAVPSTFFGLPVIGTEKTPSLGSRGDVMLVNFSEYAIGMRQELIIESSNAPGWSRDVLSFRAVLRCDGQATWAAPVTPVSGNILSWAVALDA